MNNTKSPIRSIARTFTATSNARMDGVIIDRFTHTVTLSADAQGELTATVDGVATDWQTADRLLCWARADGSVTVLETVRAGFPQGISTGEAVNLHRVLGRLGFKRHYELAGEVLGREVGSFGHLSREDAALVRSYAHGQHGLVG
jgi:YD repeat-containing protein